MTPGNPVGRSDRATVGIIGLGSIGGVIAGLLCALDRHDIIACVRHPVERLTVEQSDGAIEVPIKALTDPTEAEPRDWVLLCTRWCGL
jgi:2-dehydropantoate 2-reductase